MALAALLLGMGFAAATAQLPDVPAETASPVSTGSPGTTGSDDLTARPDQRVQLDFDHYYSLDELDAALAALATAYPEFVRLESMGRSAAGNELWVLSLTRLSDGDPEQKPGLMLVGGLGEEDLWGTEMALFTVFELLKNHERDERVAAILERAVIYVVPSAHPDLRAALFGVDGNRSGFEARSSVDGNFEIGWRPGALRAGPYPLSEAETYGLARFVLEHENIAATQLYAAWAERGSPAGLAELNPVDVNLHARLASLTSADGRPLLVGLPDLALPGGTFLEFVHGHRGAFAFLALVGGEDLAGAPDVNELSRLGGQAVTASTEIAAALPRLELSSPSIVRLSRELWQIDFVVTNAGSLPTLSELGSLRYAAGPPRVELDGAVLIAAAVEDPAAGGHAVVPNREQVFSIENLAGGAARALRVVIRGGEGETVSFEASAPRAGVARLDLTLE